MCDHLSLRSPVDQMHTYASKLERISFWGNFEGGGNDFYLRLRDCLMIWNSPNSLKL